MVMRASLAIRRCPLEHERTLSVNPATFPLANKTVEGLTWPQGISYDPNGQGIILGGLLLNQGASGREKQTINHVGIHHEPFACKRRF